ncbi:hypothetical protein [Nocardia sp. NRRL S-836]|uniref:hypothetical protein n=1 Tax=Nocardia sp. NRRL S-836 TaxID=1519492 RepID=UPI0006B02020|nr:hypothetical protein [Nocardia sp. NRRL S-836]KOV77006.1 hypothetical protein ADL03_42100 [Nocardia sp. NRRL S-836]
MVDRNVVHGTVNGSLVQAQTVHGGVHVHAPRPIVPRQLPHGAGRIAGRVSELAALDELPRSAVRVMPSQPPLASAEAVRGFLDG